MEREAAEEKLLEGITISIFKGKSFFLEILYYKHVSFMLIKKKLKKFKL